MKRNILIVIASILLIMFTAVAITRVKSTERIKSFQQIQLQNRENELKLEQIESDKLQLELDNGKAKSQEEIDRLNKEIEERKSNEERLKTELQAKLDAKKAEQDRIASLGNRITGTATASAARPSGGSCAAIQDKLAALGVPADQLAAAGQLAMRESTCNEYVVNSIGACGAFQSLPCGKWGSPGTDQYYRGAINYANSRYGGYNGALAHSLANNWY